MDGPAYMKRKVKYGNIDVDLERGSLIVNYEVEAAVLGGHGEVMKHDTKALVKKIKIAQLNEHSNIPLLAEDVVDKCDLIHEDSLPLVERLLYQLQRYQVQKGSRADSQKRIEKEARRKRKEEKRARQEAKAREEAAEKEKVEVASMDNIDTYMEMMYEETIEAKVKATALILQLARNVANLETLINNESLLGALSRTLKEEYKKNMDLTINIMHIFFSFSTFSQMHPVLVNFRIGDMCMRVMDLEKKRYSIRISDLEVLSKLAEAQANGDEEEEARIRAENAADAEEDDGTAAGGAGGAGGAGATGEGSSKREKKERKDKKERREKKEKKRRRKLPSGRVDIAAERRKAKAWMRKQETLLYVVIYMLLNVAEDVSIERKMVNRGIVQYLVPILERPSPHASLLLLTVNFLLKLSIFEENKDQMAEAEIVPKLAKFVPCNHEMLLRAVLRLLFNLSFDVKMRKAMIEQSMIPKLVNLLKLVPFRAITLRLLYHLSMDDECKSMFTYTEAIPLVKQLIVHFPERQVVAKELVALGVNLSLNHRNAELFAQDDGVELFLKRVMRTGDWMLMKMVRAISQWTLASQADLKEDDEYKQEGLWEDHVRPLFRLARETDAPEMLVEVLGTLANLTPRDLPRDTTFADLVHETGMVDFLTKHLVPGFAEDDIVLETILLISALAVDENCAASFRGGRLLNMLVSVIPEKVTDVEIVLQATHAILRLLQHRETAQELIYDTDAVSHLCELVAHKNPAVWRTADQCLEYIIDFDEHEGSSGGRLATRVRARRFQLYNKAWLSAVERDEMEDDGGDLEGKHWADGDMDDSEGSPRGPDGAPLDDSAHWHDGAMQMGRHEAVAMDMAMLGEFDEGEDSASWGAAGNGRAMHGAAGGAPGGWETSGGPGADGGPYWQGDEGGEDEYDGGGYR